MSEEYTKILHENLEKGTQVRLVVSDFRDIEYLHFRRYFLSIDGDWIPSKEGVSMPLTITGVTELCEGIAHILSNTEFSNIIEEVNARKQASGVSRSSE
jgi:hypothetical protein